MCLLALINVTSEFTDDELLDFVDRNRDGFGFMIPDPSATGGVRVAKYPSPKGFVKRFRDWQALAISLGQTQFAMHTRMRTSGKIDNINAHPHRVHEGVWLMHNGVLTINQSSNTNESDTIHYIRQRIAPIVAVAPELAMNSALCTLIASDIGVSNKFVICTPGGFMTLNKSAGVEFRGSWFSNTYAWSLHSPKSTTGGHGYAGWEDRYGDTPGYKKWHNENFDDQGRYKGKSTHYGKHSRGGLGLVGGKTQAELDAEIRGGATYIKPRKLSAIEEVNLADLEYLMGGPAKQYPDPAGKNYGFPADIADAEEFVKITPDPTMSKLLDSAFAGISLQQEDDADQFTESFKSMKAGMSIEEEATNELRSALTSNATPILEEEQEHDPDHLSEEQARELASAVLAN